MEQAGATAFFSGWLGQRQRGGGKGACCQDAEGGGPSPKGLGTGAEEGPPASIYTRPLATAQVPSPGGPVPAKGQLQGL